MAAEIPPTRVVFDLDDTLYLEKDFVRSGFVAAGNWLQRELRISGLSEVCQQMFAAGWRSRIFDAALISLGIDANPELVEALVGIYRSHAPKIALAADAARYLASRPQGCLLGMITDGPRNTQHAKVRALGLQDRLDFIVYTDALGPGCGKPHPRAFELLEAWAKPSGLPLTYVADNPAKDFVTPRTRGWWTVQVARPERVHDVVAPDSLHEADALIANLDGLDSCLEHLLSGSLAATNGRARRQLGGLA